MYLALAASALYLLLA